MSKVFVYCLASSVLFFLSGCIYYTPRTLRAQIHGTKAENKSIKVSAKELTKQDLDFYFKQNLNSNRIRAIQVNIFNQSQTPLMLEGQSIDLELEDFDFVRNKLHYNTLGRVILWSIPGILVWPFFVLAAADGYNCWIQNGRIDEDIEHKIITNHSKITIRPYATVNKIMFVRESNFYNSFTLCFNKKESKEQIELFITI